MYVVPYNRKSLYPASVAGNVILPPFPECTQAVPKGELVLLSFSSQICSCYFDLRQTHDWQISLFISLHPLSLQFLFTQLCLLQYPLNIHPSIRFLSLLTLLDSNISLPLLFYYKKTSWSLGNRSIAKGDDSAERKKFVIPKLLTEMKQEELFY